MIHWNFKKITTALLTTLGIGTLTSCYGMPPIDYGASWSANLYGDEEMKPIKGIKATLRQGNTVIEETTSDEDGYIEFSREGESYRTSICTEYVSDYFTVELSDIDGEANGGKFKSKTIEEISLWMGNVDYEPIVLEKDEQ